VSDQFELKTNVNMLGGKAESGWGAGKSPVLVYDAWNRLKVVKNSSGTTLVTYHYDARNYRVLEVVGSDTRSLY
jgi:hypothetical protein